MNGGGGVVLDYCCTGQYASDHLGARLQSASLADHAEGGARRSLLLGHRLASQLLQQPAPAAFHDSGCSRQLPPLLSCFTVLRHDSGRQSPLCNDDSAESAAYFAPTAHLLKRSDAAGRRSKPGLRLLKDSCDDVVQRSDSPTAESPVTSPRGSVSGRSINRSCSSHYEADSRLHFAARRPVCGVLRYCSRKHSQLPCGRDSLCPRVIQTIRSAGTHPSMHAQAPALPRHASITQRMPSWLPRR